MPKTEQPYYIAYEDDNYCDSYSILKGPDGWICMLGEPEDSNWYRDGSAAVDRLNEQHAEIVELREAIYKMQSEQALG